MCKNIPVVFTPEHHRYAIDIAKRINMPMLRLLYVVPATKVMGKGKKVIENCGNKRDTVTTGSPSWHRNYMNLKLPGNDVVHVFEGAVAIVP